MSAATTISKLTACGLAAGALAVPVAAHGYVDAGGGVSPQQTGAPSQDLRSPDARDAAVRSASGDEGTVVVRQDLRSPDARDAALAARQDLRSPDTRDAAIGYDPQPAEPQLVADDDSGFDWTLFGVLLSIALAVAMLLTTGVSALRHARRSATRS